MTYMNHTQMKHRVPPAAAPGARTEAEILELFDEVRRLSERYSQTSDDADYHAFAAAEIAALDAPCVSARIAAALLRFGALASMEKGDRTDGLDRDATNRVIAFLESTVSPPAIAAMGTHDDLAQLALDQKRLHDIYVGLEEIEAKFVPRSENPVSAAMADIDRHIEALEERTANLQATTAPGAMFHLALANLDATRLRDFDMDEAARLLLLERMRCRLEAVMRFVEATFGLSRADLGLDDYMPASQEPINAVN
jgi:hypothetical protein